MLELKHSQIQLKAKGSESLVAKLQYGDVKRMAEVFDTPHQKVYAIVSGKYFGDKRIVECAEKLVAFYDQVELSTNVEAIINSYGTID